MNGFQEKIVQKAMDNDSKLSSWECEFIDSLNDKPERYELSDKQNEILNRISEKVY